MRRDDIENTLPLAEKPSALLPAFILKLAFKYLLK